MVKRLRPWLENPLRYAILTIYLAATYRGIGWFSHFEFQAQRANLHTFEPWLPVFLLRPDERAKFIVRVFCASTVAHLFWLLAAIYGARQSRTTLFLKIWGHAVALSVFLVRQHHWVDYLAALALAHAVHIYFARRERIISNPIPITVSNGMESSQIRVS